VLASRGPNGRSSAAATLPHTGRVSDPVLIARARVLHDLASCGAADAARVSVVDEVLGHRRWWIDQWPQGVEFVAGQIAQDVQDAMFELGERWPPCPQHLGTGAEHQLRIAPDLGPDPHWVCEDDGTVVAPLGALPD
jgi:hypothetical protein